MRQKYGELSYNATLGDVIKWIFAATRAREFDVQDYDNQVQNNPVIYDAPSSASDIIGTEKVGDIAADASYFYIVVDNSGTLEWRRVGISTF